MDIMDRGGVLESTPASLNQLMLFLNHEGPKYIAFLRHTPQLFPEEVL